MAAPKPGGFKMSLGGLKAKPGLKASLAQKDVKRLRLALDDDEPDDSNKKQEILGWDAAEGGALEVGGKKEKEGPRIIPVPPNRDWRAEALRKKLVKAPHQQAQNRVDMAKIEEQRMDYGLTYIKKDEPRENGGAEIPASEPMEDVKDNLTNEQRLEKKALDTLLSGKSVDEDHIIPVLTEEDAFLQGLHNAPDEPTLEAYEATPIEGFGAALLRGMGWKDGEAIGKNGILPKAKETKRRPALLGIGAKAEAAVGIELGEWGPKKGKGKKVAESYNPVTLRNKRTGEMLTEEELKAKLESQEMVQEERPEKGKRKYDDEEEEEKEEEEDDSRREKRRERRDDKDRHRDRRRDDAYDSERRKDRDRKDDRRRDKDNYYDTDRRKDKRRERDRDDDYDSERRRDQWRDGDRRDRSHNRSPDDKREKRRDRDRRDRSRSRDSEDRRKRRRDRDYGYEDDREDRKRRQMEYYK